MAKVGISIVSRGSSCCAVCSVCLIMEVKSDFIPYNNYLYGNKSRLLWNKKN